MKPKNRTFCKDSGRSKMLFETEKKAGNFIKFNGEEMEAVSGYKPMRSYFCIACNGWHVTSKGESFAGLSKTEKVLEHYKAHKELREAEKLRGQEIRNQKKEEVMVLLTSINALLPAMEDAKKAGDSAKYAALLNSALEKLQQARLIDHHKMLVKEMGNRLQEWSL